MTSGRDDATLRRYREANATLDERPSEAARAAILAAAAREVKSRPVAADAPRPALRRRWPLAAAATVLLSTLAVLLATRTEQEMPVFTAPAERSEEQAKPQSAPAESSPSADRVEEKIEISPAPRQPFDAPPAPAPAAQAPAKAAAKRDAGRAAAAGPASDEASPQSAAGKLDKSLTQPDEKPAQAPQSATTSETRAGAEAPARAKAAAAPEPAAAPREAARAESARRAFPAAPPGTLSGRADTAQPNAAPPAASPPAAQSAPAAAPVPNLDAAANNAKQEQLLKERASRQDSSVQGAMQEAAPKDHERSPEAWIDYVIRLRRDGRDAEADAELKRLRERYPQVQVPAAALPPTGTR